MPSVWGGGGGNSVQIISNIVLLPSSVMYSHGNYYSRSFCPLFML